MFKHNLGIGSRSRNKPVDAPVKHGNKERVGFMPRSLFVPVTGSLAQHVLTLKKGTQRERVECDRSQELVCKL